MAHIRKPLAAAVALNTAVFAAEAVAGARASSLSLLVDAVHNLSDELALVCLLVAYLSAISLSRGLQRAANLLNSLGVVALSAVLLGQSLARLTRTPAGRRVARGRRRVLAALGNWGVARILRDWQYGNSAIRLAYLHNVGDIYVSLAPILAGLVVSMTGRSIFDPIGALGVGIWLIGSTVLELRSSAESLLWPETATCPHEESQVV